MIINDLDCGPFIVSLGNAPLQTNHGSQHGQVVRKVIVHGGREVAWPLGRKATTRSETVYVEAPAAIGGAAAGSQAAVRYLVRQLQEMSDNADLNPVYVQWRSGNGVIATDPDDGWWLIENVHPEWGSEAAGWIAVQIDFTKVSPGPPTRHGMRYDGGSLASNYVGTTVLLNAFPLNATSLVGQSLRGGAEGNIPFTTLASPPNPLPFLPSATISDWFKGGCRVYDTLNTSANPVPSASFLNATWVEVKSPEHQFVGDCVIANGLQLLIFQVGQARISRNYVWQSSGAQSFWYGDLVYNDNASNLGTVRQYSLEKVGLEEVAITVVLSTVAGNVARVRVRLQRGRYEGRIDFTPLTQGNTNTNSGLALSTAVAQKAVWNEANIWDPVIGVGTTAITTNYGYGASSPLTSTDPYIVGLLWVNKPDTSQPGVSGTGTVGFGEGGGPAINTTRTYGFFAFPYPSPQNLQGEAEGGSLGTGWTSQANAAASGGNEAKCASGTGSLQADLFGTSYVPPSDLASGDVWFLVKVTSNASSLSQMQLGLYDVTSSTYVGSTAYAPNALTSSTTYKWLRVATGVTPTVGHNLRFRAVTTAVLATDWFIDEAIFIPKQLTTDWRDPQSLWQEFMFDRAVSLVRV